MRLGVKERVKISRMNLAVSKLTLQSFSGRGFSPASQGLNMQALRKVSTYVKDQLAEANGLSRPPMLFLHATRLAQDAGSMIDWTQPQLRLREALRNAQPELARRHEAQVAPRTMCHPNMTDGPFKAPQICKTSLV